MKTGMTTFMVLIAATIGATTTFVMNTVFMSIATDASMIAMAAVGGAVLSVAFGGMPAKSDLEHRRAVLLSVVGGIAAFWAAPAIALSQRASDAPPGTEVLFFTTSAWALIIALVDAARRGWTGRLVSVAGMMMALLGGATVVANWERPSSFSPFVRFPQEEALMLLAGLVFALGVTAVRHGAESGLGRRKAGSVATLSAALVALAVFLPSSASELPLLLPAWRAAAVLGVGYGTFVVAWNHLFVRRTGSAPIALAFVPVAFLSLTALERLTAMRGPDPVVWSGALAGAGLVIVGAGLSLTGRVKGTDAPVISRIVPIAAAVVASAAVGTLFLPAMDAEVIGVMGGEYRAAWTMLGAETSGGWLVALTGLLLAAALIAGSAGRYRQAAVSAALGLVALGLYPAVAATPLRTATRWIPADVQQTYGTEYARLTFVPVHDFARLGVLGACAILALAIIISATVRHSRRTGSEEAS